MVLAAIQKKKNVARIWSIHDAVRTQKGRGNNGIHVVQMAHEPYMFFIEEVQTWYERERLKCVHTTIIAYPLRPFHVSGRSENVVNAQ